MDREIENRKKELQSMILEFRERTKGGRQYAVSTMEFDPSKANEPVPEPVTVDKDGNPVPQEELNEYYGWLAELEKLNYFHPKKPKQKSTMTTETKAPLLTVFVGGVTNTGKSTFIEDLLKDIDNIQADPEVADRLMDSFGEGFFLKSGSVHVGKEMRKLFPPEQFQGKGAMPETEETALRIYREGMEKNSGCDLVVVDGQPRLRSQIPLILDQSKGPTISRFYVFLTCPDEELNKRIKDRDGHDEQKLLLSKKRLVNDKTQLYDVITDLICRREYVTCIDSTNPGEIAMTIRSIVARVMASKLARDIEKNEGLQEGAADIAANHIIGEVLQK